MRLATRKILHDTAQNSASNPESFQRREKLRKKNFPTRTKFKLGLITMAITHEQRVEIGRAGVLKRWKRATKKQRTAEAYRLLAARDQKYGKGKTPNSGRRPKQQAAA